MVALVSLLVPSAVYAQAAITGVVRDASGAVLPGATVEAASPVLIEKVRSVATDATGQYRIVDLRPGVYSVTFSLPGFTTVKREGIELSGNFVATVNADLRVGALEETITVTGESPIVDVQSTRSQQIIDKDVLAAIPSSRNVAGIQAIIPGMNTAGDDGGIAGTMQGGASAIHGGRANDSRIYADGINMGWAGSSGGGGQMPQVAAAQEVVMTISGGLAEAETSGLVFNAVPREGSNTFTGQFNFSGSNDSLQGSNYTQSLKDAGLRAPFELINVYDVSAMYGGRIVRDKLWFYGVYRQVGGERTVPGMFQNRNAGNPNAWTVDFDRSQQAFNNSLERQATIRLTWQATPRNKFNFHWAEQYNDANYGPGGGAGARTTPEASSRVLYIPSRQPTATLAVADLGQVARRGWLGHVSGPVPLRDAQRRDAQPGDDPAVGADRRARLCRPGRLHPWPALPDATRTRAGRLHAFVDREPRQLAGVVVVCHRFPQHEVRLPGRVRQSVPDLPELHPGRSGPNEQRRAEPAHSDHFRRAGHQIRPQSHPDEFLRAGPVDAQPADRAGRRAVRLPDLELSRPGHRRSRLAVRPRRDLLSEPLDRLATSGKT